MATNSQDGLTLDEHRQLSSELAKTQRQLEEFCSLANEVYGAESRPGIAFSEAAEAVGRLRFVLRLQAADDCPGEQADDFYA